jgi:hypothetical protein
MPRAYTTRKLEVFSITAHVTRNGNPPRQVAADYAAVFSAISNLPPAARVTMIGEKHIAIPRCSMNGNVVRLTAYEGEEEKPIVFNFRNATERIERLGTGEQIATRTHGIIDVSARLAIIEFNQRGAKAADIAAALEQFGRTLGDIPTLQMYFSHMLDEQFILAIDRFERIRTATVKIARPNPGWGDDEATFSQMAEASDAQYLEVSATAGRMGSLDRNAGIVAFIKRVAARAFPFLKAARLSGIREGEIAETSVSTTNHVEHQRVSVRTNEDGHVLTEDVDRRLEDFRRAKTGQN